MATTLRNGSKGADVKKLQQALIDAGYNVGKTGADGILGKNTESAIKQYQKDHGLSVDGIAGKDTQGSLYGTSSSSSGEATKTAAKAAVIAPKATAAKAVNATAANAVNTQEAPAAASVPADVPEGPVTTQGGFTYGDFNYGPFAPSEVVQQANSLLQQQYASKPGDYTPVWQDEADAYLSQYQNRGPFSYDFNADALYQQYKDNYIRQGQMAMMDTMGQAAAMTGGYGNSYAQSVGQQAYNQYLGQLNNVMPELYQMAHDRYSQEGQNLLAMYDLYMGREAQEYGKYQDTLNNWYQEMARLTDNYNTAYDREYDAYLDRKNTAYNEYLTDREEAFNEWQFNTEMNYQKERDAIADAQYAQSRQDKLAAAMSGGDTESQYGTLSTADMDWLQKQMQRAGKYDQNLADYWAYNLGVNPNMVRAIMLEMYGGYQPIDTTVNTPISPHASGKSNGGYNRYYFDRVHYTV